MLNILTYHNNDKKIMIYFSNMCYDAYYHLVKFQLKTPPIHGEMKKDKLCKGVIWTKKHNLGGKINQTIV